MTIFSYNCNFIFVHIPKCGGTSVEAGWQKIGRWGDFVIGSTLEGELLQGPFRNLYNIDKHATANRIKRAVGRTIFERSQVIVLVRNPISIVESHYKFGRSLMNQSIAKLEINEDRLRQMINARDECLPSWWFVLTKGALIDAMHASNFEDFVDRVLDDRWARYLSRHTHDPDNRRLTTITLKIEEPKTITRTFNSLISEYHKDMGIKRFHFSDGRRYKGKFTLSHLNRSQSFETRWEGSRLQKLCDITEQEHLVFGYELPL